MDPEMSHRNCNVCVTPAKYIFGGWTLRCCCHKIYFCSGMALEYILWKRGGKDIFFWSVGVSGVLIPAKNLSFFCTCCNQVSSVVVTVGDNIRHCSQGPVCTSKYRNGDFCKQKIAIKWGKFWGLISAPPIPVEFQPVLWIPVEFQQNLPAKISILPQNCVILVFTLKCGMVPRVQSLEWHWNPMTRNQLKNAKYGKFCIVTWKIVIKF